jgi:chromosome partitioning protein
MDLIDILRGASAILVPVLPSSIDLYVTEAFIQDLRKMARLHAPGAGIAAVANRVHLNTRSYQFLRGVLDELGLPPIASLRDTEFYLSAAESGVSIHEMSGDLTREDQKDWAPLVEWLAHQH